MTILKNTRFWIVAVLLLLLFSAGTAYGLNQMQRENCIANIYQDGTLLRSIDLAQVTQEERFVITDAAGNSNTIVVMPGKIAIEEATCPDHVCIQQGWITDGVYPIVCLPNKLIIRIEDDSKQEDTLDIMAQ